MPDNSVDSQWREMNYEQFRSIVVKCAAKAQSCRSNLCEYFNCRSVNKANVGGMLFEVVCRLLRPMSFDLRELLRRFERMSIWDAVSKSESVYPIGAVIDVLLDAKKQGLKGSSTSIDAHFEASFSGAIAAAVDRVVIAGPYVGEDIYKQMKFRDFDECRAALELQSKGYQIEIHQDSSILLTRDSERQLFSRLDSLMKNIGGRKALHLLWCGDKKFPQIVPLLSKMRRHNRWPLCRIWADDSEYKNQFEQLFPYNYWLNLAVKHFNSDGISDDGAIVECLSLILTYSRFVNVIPSRMATIYDVMKQKQFIPTLQKIAQYSHLYKIDQMRMKDAVDIIESCSEKYLSLKVRDSITLAQVVCVLKALARIFDGKTGPTMFSVNDICGKVGGLRTEIVRRAINLFVAKGGVPNQNYINPNNPDGYDLYRKPVIKRGDDYCVVDPSMAASGFLSEFVFSGFFGLEPNDKKIGPFIENMIKQRFVDKGLNPISGYFSVDGGIPDAYEADAIMADADSIVAVEIKKKSMKEESRCGNSLQLIRDLAAGLLDDVKQARRYLGELARHHRLELHKIRNSTVATNTLCYSEGAKMTIVAMPLFDFDAFQTPAFTRSFFHKCGESINVRFSGGGPAPTEEDIDSCERLNKCLGQYQKVANDYPEIRDIPVAVISVPQMMCLLDEVKSSKDFHRLIWNLPHLDFGSFDFYMALDMVIAYNSSDNR